MAAGFKISLFMDAKAKKAPEFKAGELAETFLKTFSLEDKVRLRAKIHSHLSTLRECGEVSGFEPVSECMYFLNLLETTIQNSVTVFEVKASPTLETLRAPKASYDIFELAVRLFLSENVPGSDWPDFRTCLAKAESMVDTYKEIFK